MSLERIPHDEFFKCMMQDLAVARDFFEAHLPATIKQQLDFATLWTDNTTFINSQLKSRHSDMLYRAKLLKNAEQEVYLFLHIEHTSSVEPIMPFRVCNYLMQLLDKHVRQAKNLNKNPLPLPLVWSCVFYNGRDSYYAEREFFALFGEHSEGVKSVFNNPFHLIDVSLQTNVALQGQKWASILSWCMRHSSQRDFLPYVAEFGSLIRDAMMYAGDSRLQAVLNYVASSLDTPASRQEVIEALLKELPLELEEDVMRFGERIYDEGRVEGRVAGIDATLEAVDLLRQGLTLDVVAAETDLDLEVVRKLCDSMSH